MTELANYAGLLARGISNQRLEQKGFAERNLNRMMTLYRECRAVTWSTVELMPQAVAQIVLNVCHVFCNREKGTGSVPSDNTPGAWPVGADHVAIRDALMCFFVEHSTC